MKNIIVSLFLLSFFLSANATKWIIGTPGSGLSVVGMGSYSPGDTLAINAGTYTGETFGNIHDVTIINYGGVVTFTGQVYWGAGYSGGTYLYNINFTGSGTSATYGFVFSGISNSVFRCFLSTTTTGQFYGNRFERFWFKNNSGNPCFDLFNTTLVYDGTSSTFLMRNSTFNNIKCDTTGVFINASENPTSGLMDSITISNCIINQTQTGGQVVTGTIFRFNIHDNRMIYYSNNSVQPDGTDIGKFFLFGNGTMYNNFMYGGRGYITRLIVATAGTTPSETFLFNNIELATDIYGGFDIRGNSSNYASSPYLTYGNVHIINNTIGNKSTSPINQYTTAMLVFYPTTGSVELKNNLSFNDWKGGSYTNGTIANFSGGGTLDSASNIDLTGAQAVALLQDTNYFCVPKSTAILLNGKGVYHSYINSDIQGDTLSATTTPIGASKYVSSGGGGTTYPPVSNPGSNQSVNFNIVDSVIVNGSASYSPNSGGSISSYAWSQTSGPGAVIASASSSSTVIYLIGGAGIYSFALTVTDNLGASSTSYVIITANTSNSTKVLRAPRRFIINITH